MAMRFKRNLSYAASLHPITFVPFLNCAVLIAAVLTLSFPLLLPSSTKVRLPRAVTSDTIAENSLTILITSEDIIYVNDRIMTDKELKKVLSLKPQGRPILIKADGRSSLMRTIDVWNICRALGFEQVNVATTKSK